MRKQKITFEQEEKNTQDFLQKLQSIKKSSKMIKDRSKFTAHKVEWAREYKHLARVDRNMDKQITETCEWLDTFFVREIEEYQVFGRDQYKTFSELNTHHNDRVDTHSANLFYQIDSLRSIVNKVAEGSDNQKLSEIEQIKNQVGDFLLQMTESVNKEAQELGTVEFPQGELAEQDNNFTTGYVFDEVKGFDLGRDILKGMKENEVCLQSLRDMFTGQGLQKDEEAQLVTEFQRALGFLQERFQLEIQKNELDYEEALNFSHDMLKESENFAKLSHIYNSYLGRGKDRSLYYERLSIEFPQLSRKSLELLTGYIEAKIYKTRKLRALQRDYWRQKGDLVEKAEQQITLTIETKLENARRQAERLQRREESLNIAQELKKFRAIIDQKKLDKLNQAEMQRKAQEEAKKREEKIWKEHVQEVNKKNNEFQIEKDRLTKAQIQKRQAQAKKERDNKIKMLQDNKPKVQVRQSLESRKLKERISKKQQTIIDARNKQQRIQMAIQGYEHRPIVQSDPKRLQKPTVSLISKKVEYDKADKVELVKVHGYTVNQLMSDMRYKLGSALQDAGLGGTDYARQVLIQMSRPPNQQQ